MTINELLKTIRENYEEAGLDQLETWMGQLTMEYAFIASNMAECAKNRPLKEIEIKKKMIEETGKAMEAEVERMYYATEEGQFLQYNNHFLKALGKVLSFIKFRVKSLRGEI